MDEVALRELRNHTSEVLHRVEAGEELTVTVSGRPVARLVPLPPRRPYLARAEIVANRADAGLLDDLRETTDDLDDPWDKAPDQ
ncbi:type II toxin-antitoxin system Phd/YefM family antitoxin [Kutzneria buriramensis]|uniref:Antitoxin n=1 Tax=Kutzneria buriramensis TaxID=1045776 RepID=A0A3E0H6D9_9PSEU|nr:type II toxin-antitoxin system prevent-host-death family antitoxin [Kutzneria buriramensis]REH38230.1 prevent-host-death family protein [Kutzneria buriramensis]